MDDLKFKIGLFFFRLVNMKVGWLWEKLFKQK